MESTPIVTFIISFKNGKTKYFNDVTNFEYAMGNGIFEFVHKKEQTTTKLVVNATDLVCFQIDITETKETNKEE